MKHGYAHKGKPRPNIYRRWQHMIQRCHNPNDRDYARYGAKGIQVCEQWRFGADNLSGFECFLRDMGEPSDKALSIDRTDVHGHYEPTNCRWATAKEQANNRTSTKYLTIDGETLPLSTWCERYNIGSKTVLFRLKHMGMTHKEAVTTPLKWTKGKQNELETNS